MIQAMPQKPNPYDQRGRDSAQNFFKICAVLLGNMDQTIAAGLSCI